MDIGFPLKERILHRGCAEHKVAGLGCAADYEAVFVDLYSPVDGSIFLFDEPQGGHWIRVTDATGRKWEMAHLSERYVKTGENVKRGQKIGKTGNTGTVTTGPHLHLQIIQGSTRIDPVPLLANAPFPMPEDPFGNKIIRSTHGTFAYVKGGTNKKEVITKANAGFALLTFLDRCSPTIPIRDQIVNVSDQRWASFSDVPDGTWF